MQMKAFVVAVLCSVASVAQAESPPGPTSDASVLAHDLREGGLVLFNEVAGTDNAVFSPYALQTAMGMMYLSAHGETAEDVAHAMRWTLAPKAIGPAFNHLNEALATAAAQSPNVALESASRLWASDVYHLNTAYTSTLRQQFQSTITTLDLAHDPEGSRRTINSWVDEKTAHAIPNLLPPDSLKGSSLVQTAAIHFKAPWGITLTRDTVLTPFHTSDTQLDAVSMARGTVRIPYGETADYQAADIPYGERGALSMLVILPKGNLQSFAANLDAAALETVQDQLSASHVDLALPEFEMRMRPDVTAALQALGLSVAMTNAANFSVFEDVGTRIMEIYEEAWIAVDKDGTEAAAAAAVVSGPTSAPLPPQTVELTLDRPFLYIIHDNDLNVPLFVGQFMHPSSATALQTP